MAEATPQRNHSAFTALTAVTVAVYFAFTLYAAWVILQYGVKTADFGWQIQRIGQNLYVVSIEEKGPAVGSLEIGDRILAINGEAITTEGQLGIALKSVAGAGLYGLRVQRSGAEREVWLRSRTRAGFSFFQHRLPLLGSSILIFFCGLAMLLKWNSPAARFGFLAAALTALRMGSWAILPLSTYFQQREFLPLFLFCLPAGLAIPLAFQSLRMLGENPASPSTWKRAPWALAAFWIAILLFGAPTGSIPAPVPEGLAFLYADRVEYRQTSPLVQYGIPLYVASAVVLIGLWIRRVYAATPEGDLKRRFQWIFLCGIFFAAPAGIFEITEWLGAHSGVTGWNWLLAMTALAYQHVLKVDRIAGPAQVVRAAFSRILPESLFRKFDHRYFPKEAAIEDNLRAVASELDACNQLDRLDSILTHGLEQAVGAPGIDLSEERETTDTLPLAPKHNGEVYTRRERRLIERAVSHFFVAQERLRKKEEPVASPAGSLLNLMRECPRCGACFDSDVVRCPHDQEVPLLRLPVERIVDGKYILERLIGRGGMGAVYEARDRRLNRRVALKVMLSELFGQQAALQRFEREAQLAAKLSHPNIIQIHDFGPIGAMGAYQVMEYVEGRSWREELNTGGAIPPATCAHWFAQLLDGIEAAHSCGIIHRDLKPENLLLEDRGHGRAQVKILDFGLAKMQLLNLSREERLSIGVNTIGTVGYVPPEQLTGAATDTRSDIYAIGRILAETLTGSLPEEGCPGLDPQLAAVVAKCTAIRKEDRYASIAELRPELLAALDAKSNPQPNPHSVVTPAR
ncbi:MAG: protein kinase [Acidobacteria bacterium]|nr:protein kinase [Acidobacteriota bacterium]